MASDAKSSLAQPVILWKNDPRRGRIVVDCCDRSAQLGVRPAIAIAQATELVYRATKHNTAENASAVKPIEPIAVEHDPIADRLALEKIADQLQVAISPMVAIESLEKRPWSGRVLSEPDTLFCDLHGIVHLFGNEQGVINAVHRILHSAGVIGKVAIADTPASAWAHAHYNPQADFISNQGVGDLLSIPVNGLRIETETKYTLDRLGIQTIGSLLRLPRAGLARRLGETIVNRIGEVVGEIDVPIEVHHGDQQVAESLELEYPTDDLEIIDDRIEGLVEQIVARLATNQRGALRLVCRLDLVGHSQLTTTIGLFAPTLDGNHLASLVQSSVETLKVKAPIVKLTLQVLQSDRMRSRQNSLFTEAESSIACDSVSDRSLAQLVDSLTGRLGRNSVLGIRMANNPLPEKAYRVYSLTDHRTRRALSRLPSKIRPAKTGKSLRLPSASDTRRRPMRLLRTPIQLTLIRGNEASNQSTQMDRPVSAKLPAFRTDGQNHYIAYWWGPERIETGWWEGPSVRRDYYRIETDTGQLWWIFRDITSGNWFLHGRFS